MQATFRFASGATGTIAYLTGGNARFPKETMDATGGGRSARLDNFKTAAVWTGRGKAADEGARRPGQGPAGRDGGSSSRPSGPAARCRSAWTRCSRPRGPRSRWARACSAAGRSGCERDRHRRSSAGTRRRLGRMSPAEVAWRVREQALRRAWARRQVRPGPGGRAAAAADGGRPERAVHLRAAAGRRRLRARGGQGRDHRRRGPAAQAASGRCSASSATDMEEPGLVPRPGDRPPVRPRRRTRSASTSATRRRSATSSRSGRSTGCST